MTNEKSLHCGVQRLYYSLRFPLVQVLMPVSLSTSTKNPPKKIPESLLSTRGQNLWSESRSAQPNTPRVLTTATAGRTAARKTARCETHHKCLRQTALEFMLRRRTLSTLCTNCWKKFHRKILN